MYRLAEEIVEQLIEVLTFKDPELIFDTNKLPNDKLEPTIFTLDKLLLDKLLLNKLEAEMFDDIRLVFVRLVFIRLVFVRLVFDILMELIVEENN